MSTPEKIVMVGDQLTSDIFFGNLNNMATVWTHSFTDYFNQYKFHRKGKGYKLG